MVEKSGRTFYIQYLAYLLLGDLMCSGQGLKGKASIWQFSSLEERSYLRIDPLTFGAELLFLGNNAGIFF